jgi:hypothetical protein
MVAHSATNLPRSRVGTIPRSDSLPLSIEKELTTLRAAEEKINANDNFPARAKRALGTNTGFASTAQRSTEFRYYLQKLACELLPGEKINICHKYKTPNEEFVKVSYDPEHETVHVKNLMCCDRRNICAVCAAKITEQDRNELLIAIAHSGYRAALFTYTLSHHLGENLHTVKNKMTDAYRFLKSGRIWQDIKERYKVVGSIRSQECNYGPNGWHPHIHEVMLFDASITDEQLSALEFEIKNRWDKAIERFDGWASWENGVDMKIGDDELHEYVAKNGHEPVDCKWTIEHELVKSDKKLGRGKNRNMWQVLADYGDGDKHSGELFQEFAWNWKGDHAFQWSPNLKAIIGIVGGEEVDQELLDQAQESHVQLAELNEYQWAHIVKTENRGELRKQARCGDREQFQAWLKSIGVPQFIRINLNDWLDRPAKQWESG